LGSYIFSRALDKTGGLMIECRPSPQDLKGL
jgi:hypothetical protein